MRNLRASAQMVKMLLRLHDLLPYGLPCRWVDAGKFLTGFSAVGSIAIPAILAHANVSSLLLRCSHLSDDPGTAQDAGSTRGQHHASLL